MQRSDIATVLDRSPSLADVLNSLDRSLPAWQLPAPVMHPVFPVHRSYGKPRKVATK